ncbi:MAG: NUDIX domain-containing protein [Candidatus Roizmanbacteria bacterium]|nr:NUDIX domain-containing protein [Candidatus Roizmanbacteria bacterium]
MHNSLQSNLLLLLENVPSLNTDVRRRFITRITEGNLTRDENPLSHLCVYFAAYDPKKRQVFMGKHIKSGLWLFNGGHVDKNESLEAALYREMQEEWGLVQKININTPSLFTITKIENPKKQTCEWHYDIWYFIPFKKDLFHPIQKLLSKEFFEWGWKTTDEAQILARDRATLIGIDAIASQSI